MAQPTHTDAIRLLSKHPTENAGKLAILKLAQQGVQDPEKLRAAARNAKGA